MPPVYFVPIHISGYRASISLNGAPVMTSPGFLRNVVQVNQWVVHGQNVLDVRVDEETPVSAERALSVSLGEGDSAHIPGLGLNRRLAVIPPVGEGPLPRDLSAGCRLTPPFPRWRWQTAEPVAVTEATRRQVIDRAAELHAMLRRRDVDALEAAVMLVLEEVPPAYDTTVDDARAKFRRIYSSIFADDDYAVAPFAPEPCVVRQCCGQRLTTLETLSGASVLRAATYDSVGGWSLPFWFGLYQGEWAHLR